MQQNEANQQGQAMEVPEPHIKETYEDKTVFDDAASIIIHNMKRQSSTSSSSCAADGPFLSLSACVLGAGVGVFGMLVCACLMVGVGVFGMVMCAYLGWGGGCLLYTSDAADES